MNGKYLEDGGDICICKSDSCNGGKALALLNGTNSLTINHGMFGIFIFSILVYIGVIHILRYALGGGRGLAKPAKP